MENRKELKEVKTGLVMEGGAMRGIFTMGVIDVMMENAISYDGGIGVSAGAVFGCNYKSKQNGRVIRYNKRFCRDKRFASLHSLVTTGNLYGVQMCYHDIPERLDPFDNEAYESNPMEFYCVATNIETGKAEYHLCRTASGEDLLWLQASASLPLVSQIVEVGGYKLVDGGIGDSVPLAYFESIGYRKNVVILTQPRTYRKTKSKYLPFLRLKLHRYPKLIQAVENRHIRYNKNISYVWRRRKEGAAFVICPPEPLNIGGMKHEPEDLERVYQLGRRTMEQQLPELKAFLANEK